MCVHVCWCVNVWCRHWMWRPASSSYCCILVKKLMRNQGGNNQRCGNTHAAVITFLSPCPTHTDITILFVFPLLFLMPFPLLLFTCSNNFFLRVKLLWSKLKIQLIILWDNLSKKTKQSSLCFFVPQSFYDISEYTEKESKQTKTKQKAFFFVLVVYSEMLLMLF